MKKVVVDTLADVSGPTGILLSVGVPTLNTLTHVAQLAGALGGLLLLFWSVRHKRAQALREEAACEEDQKKNGTDA